MNNLQYIWFKSISRKIRTIDTGTNLLFHIKDLSSSLSYSSSNYLKQYYCVRTRRASLYNKNYVDIKSVNIILNRCTKSQCKILAQEIEKNEFKFK